MAIKSLKSAINLFNNEELAKITEKLIKVKDGNTSEIFIHIEDKCEYNSLERAKLLWKLLWKTNIFQSGILIYIASQSKKISIVAQSAIYKKFET